VRVMCQDVVYAVKTFKVGLLQYFIAELGWKLKYKIRGFIITY